jgi:hypothetical protein
MPSRSSPDPSEPKWWRVLPAVVCLTLLAAALVDPVAVASPPFYALQAIFRRLMYSIVAGAEVQSPLAFAAYFAVVFVAVGALLVVFRRRVINSAPPGSYIGRAAKGLGLIVFVVYAANWHIQGGLGIPLALLYVAVLMAFWWELQRVAWARRMTAAVVWIGAGFLLASGVVLPLLQGAPRFDLQRLHGVYGYLWLSALGAYLIDHITRYEATRETPARNRGYLAATILSAVVLTGVARLHGGGATWASGLWLHVSTAVLAIAAVTWHVGRSWHRRGFAAQPTVGSRSARFLLACLAVGAMLPVLPMAFAGPSGEQVASSCDQTQLAAADVGVTGSGPNRSCLPLALVSERDAEVGCGKNGGCHVDTFAQWQHSAHRFSANAAYRSTVRLMIAQVGIEPARQCASCHDPLPLLAGHIVAGSKYPDEGSEGVTCVVCHSMQPGREGGHGFYRVEPSAQFNDSVRDPFTAYMMIELYGDEHRDEFKTRALTDNSICAPCHNLTTHRGVVLRRTFDEWSEGPFGPTQPGSKRCTECHMPPLGRGYLQFPLHDHRMPAANVALAPLRGDAEPETERRFVGDALDLRVAISRRPSDGFQLEARLTNARGAHRFPTAPLDLLDYWFEVQFEGTGVEPRWQRVNQASLFAEQLIASDGRVLTEHEIWQAVDKHGPEGIGAGEARDYTFPLPAPPDGVERVTVRLMHRRYQDAFLRFLGSAGATLYTDPIEVLRRSVDWTANAPAGGETTRAETISGATS